MIDAIIVKKLLEFLEEDIYPEDLTSRIVRDIDAKGYIVVKENAVLAGLKFIIPFLEYIGIKITKKRNDGEILNKGDRVIEFEGNAYNILSSERTILNLLSKLSGIATVTRLMVQKARRINPNVIIAATRKTTPGLRIFEKYAVEVGGGDPHRFNLYDAILIKDNHIALLGSIEEAIKRVRSYVSFTKKIEVEVNSVKDALIAYNAGADIILLDNMSTSEISEVVKLLKGKVLLEASGRITPDNVEDYAKTGVDIISSGYITHSAKSIDMSLDVEKYEMT